MEFFIDTANIQEIKEINSWGVLSGVTTNPSLISKENNYFENLVEGISNLIDGPISVEVTALDYENMLKQARLLSKINDNIVIKIPITEEGLKAIKTLSKENIKVNATLIFSVNQGILAARAGASYVSPFIGRLDDIEISGMDTVKNLVDAFKINNFETKIIAASIRNRLHIEQCALFGVDYVTVPYKIFKQMIKHPLTDQGIEKFNEDFKNVKLKGEF